jgi:hypothetical protein
MATIGEALAQIERLDLSFLKTTFMERHGYSDEEYENALSNLKRFFALTVQHQGPLAITNKSADDLWHMFILFTPQYRNFCKTAFDEYLDHQPHGPMTPVPPEAFSNLVEAHTRIYGPLDKSWLEDLPVAAQLELSRGLPPSDLGFRWSGWTGRPRQK